MTRIGLVIRLRCYKQQIMAAERVTFIYQLIESKVNDLQENSTNCKLFCLWVSARQPQNQECNIQRLGNLCIACIPNLQVLNFLKKFT
jgi:hypothetical protein